MIKKILHVQVVVFVLFLSVNSFAQSKAKFDNINGLNTSYPVLASDMPPSFIRANVSIDVWGEVNRDGAVAIELVANTLSVDLSGINSQILPHQIEPLAYEIMVYYKIITRYGYSEEKPLWYSVLESGEKVTKTTNGAYEEYSKVKNEIGNDKSANELANYAQLNIKITRIKIKFSGASSKRIIKEYIEGSNNTTNSEDNSGNQNNNSNTTTSSNQNSSYNGNTQGNTSNNGSITSTGDGGYAAAIAARDNKANATKTNVQKSEESKQNYNEWVQRNNEAARQRSEANRKAQSNNATQSTTTNNTNVKTLEQRNLDFQEQSRKTREAEERRLAQKRATMKRLEYHNRDNITTVANHINNVIATKIDISSINRASSPQEVINSLRRVKQQVAQKKQDISTSYVQTMNYINSNTATTKDEANSNMLAAGVATGVAIGATIKANNDQKKAEAAAEKKLLNMYWQLDKAYEKAMSNALEQSVYTKDANTEQYSLDQYFYYKCVRADMKNRFSYSNAYWTNPRNCTEPSYSSIRSAEPSYLDIAKRKMGRFKEYKYDLFKTVALNYAQMSINKNQNKSDALVFKAEYTEDITERYSAILYAKSLKKRSFKHGDLLDKTKNEFDKVFYTAIDNQDISFLKNAMEISLYPSVNQNGETPLMYAASTDKVGSMRLLLEYSTKVSKSQKKQLLQIACKEDSPKVLTLLIEEGVSFKRKSYYKNPVPIEIAFYNDSKDAFTILVENGADFKKVKRKIKDKDSYNFQMAKLLTIASIKSNDMKLIEEADKYAILDDVLYFDQILSSLSSKNNQANNILATRIKDKWMTDKTGKSLVHHAIINDNYDFLIHLLDDGYANRIKDYSGYYPVHYVLDLPPTSKILQNIGALKLNMDVETNDKIPFLHLSYYNANVDYYSLFSNPTIDVNTTGLNGWSVLHYAARRGDVKLVQYLLDNGADKTIEDQWGRTAFFIAKERVGSQFNNSKVTNKDYAKIKKMLKPTHKLSFQEILKVYW